MVHRHRYHGHLIYVFLRLVPRYSINSFWIWIQIPLKLSRNGYKYFIISEKYQIWIQIHEYIVYGYFFHYILLILRNAAYILIFTFNPSSFVLLVFSKCFRAEFWAFSMFKYRVKGVQIYVNYLSFQSYGLT